jgi:succinate dehydrogenase/fumarate reductase-like Fe-S protein
MKVELHIRRWDPGVCPPERVDNFTLDMPAGDSVLSALVRVYEEHDDPPWPSATPAA